jgi:hypothetical protein
MGRDRRTLLPHRSRRSWIRTLTHRRTSRSSDPALGRLFSTATREATVAHKHKRIKIGYDYVHTATDDHTRLAYSEIHADERDATAPRSCTAFWPGSPARASGCAACRPGRRRTGRGDPGEASRPATGAAERESRSSRVTCKVSPSRISCMTRSSFGREAFAPLATSTWMLSRSTHCGEVRRFDDRDSGRPSMCGSSQGALSETTPTAVHRR